MASESTEEGSVTVTLPPELDDWLDERAAALDVDREAVLVQLVASYRAAAELEGEAESGQGMLLTEPDAVENAVESTLEGHLSEVVEQRVSDAVSAMQQPLDQRLEDLEDDYTADLEDVRDRVIQLKRELDGKASADHTHEEIQRVGDVDSAIEELRERLGDQEATISEVEEDLEAVDDDIDEVETEIDELRDRLQTVAWVVSDLRDAQERRSGLDPVDRIKRAAAQMDVDRARCENCESGVEIALMTDPECPHCQATVTDVQAANGFFGKPRLLVASQLESGEKR